MVDDIQSLRRLLIQREKRMLVNKEPMNSQIMLYQESEASHFGML